MSKIINAVLSRFSAKYKSIDELGKLYLTQLLGHLDYKMTAVYLSRRRREQAGWRYIVRQPATGGGSGEHATAAVRT